MRAQAAGEQAVAVGDVHLVFGGGAAGAQAAGDDIGPIIDVALGVTDHRRAAGGTRGGMDAHHLLHRHCEGVERVVVAQILLGGVGEARQIAQLFEIVGVYAGLVEFAFVHRHIVVGVVQRPLQTRQLQRFNLIARGEFDRFEGLWIYCHG